MSTKQAGRPRRRYAPRLPPEQRREQLLDGALSVILGQGYNGVSVEAVAREVGVTRPVVYDHFANLGSLLGALVQREERYALAQLQEILPDDPSGYGPDELLGRGVRRFLDAVSSRPATWRLILLPLEGTPEIVRRQVERQRDVMLGRIKVVVRLAIEPLGLPADFDIELAARAIRDLGEHAGRQVLLNPKRYRPERYEQFVRSVIGLIWASK